jgi:hypothetical protein
VLLQQRREGVQQRLPVGPPEVLRFVVNAVAYRSFGALITGVQIGPDRSRIDFKLAGFSREQAPDFEERVNEVIAQRTPAVFPSGLRSSTRRSTGGDPS